MEKWTNFQEIHKNSCRLPTTCNQKADQLSSSQMKPYAAGHHTKLLLVSIYKVLHILNHNCGGALIVHLYFLSPM